MQYLVFWPELPFLHTEIIPYGQKISETLIIVTPFTTSVDTYYWKYGHFPTSREKAGQPNIVTSYIDENIISSNGYISVDY